MIFKIKEAREKMGFSQKELASQLGIKPTTFNGYEKGIHDPKSDVLIQIAEKCHVSVDFLLGLDDKGDTDLDKFELNNHEKKVIIAYRNNPQMQYAVDKLLNVSEKAPIIVLKAARSKDNTEPIGTIELSEEQLKRLNDAPRVTDEEDL